jgi:hypothetical protein
MAFEVRSILTEQLVDGGPGGICLQEVEVSPYIKDYDRTDEALETRLIDWASRFDISNCGLFLMCDGSIPIAGAAVAFKTPAVNMLEGLDDLAVLWDIPVHADHRWLGTGTQFLGRACE